MTCDEARTHIPFYAAQTLSEDEGNALVAHMAGCPPCQAELVEALKLAHVLRRARAPRLPPGAWLPVAARTVGLPVLALNVGPALGGVQIEVQASPGRPRITGNLAVLGQKIPIMGI
ncbi:MAG: zf-HC2 domain-containing protein [Candidatus Bipolaricaulota bacterium]|nr:zf-HC2 domain-containing protein [Candidatus Bipolaricaulota bacterium]